jgi:shikimate kinase
MPVITIGREFGAGGETVGRLVAQRLVLEFLDSKIVDEVARRLKVGTEVVEDYDEKRVACSTGSAPAGLGRTTTWCSTPAG